VIAATYLSPQGRAVVDAHAAVLKAQREARRTERLQARLFPAACEAFKALGWSDSAAQELADIHVHGSKA
jgi:hypothetical protein